MDRCSVLETPSPATPGRSLFVVLECLQAFLAVYLSRSLIVLVHLPVFLEMSGCPSLVDHQIESLECGHHVAEILQALGDP